VCAVLSAKSYFAAFANSAEDSGLYSMVTPSLNFCNREETSDAISRRSRQLHRAIGIAVASQVPSGFSLKKR